MTLGTAKVYKASTTPKKDGSFPLGMNIPEDVIKNEKLVPGSTVEFNITRLENMDPEPPTRKADHFRKEVNVPNEEGNIPLRSEDDFERNK